MSLTEDLGMVDELDCDPEFEEDHTSVERALQQHREALALEANRPQSDTAGGPAAPRAGEPRG